MNPAEWNLLLDTLPQLSQIQLNDLAVRIQLLVKTANSHLAGKQDFGNRLLQVICSVLKKQGVETSSPLSLKKSTAYVSSKSKIDDLSVFLQTISKSKLVQDQILSIGVDLLYTDLLNWQSVSVSSHTLLRQIHRIPSTLNRHFPGYVSSGLLIKLVKEK